MLYTMVKCHWLFGTGEEFKGVPRRCFFCGFIFHVCLVCFSQPCDHLLGKGWPLGSLVCCILLCFCHFSIYVLIHIRTKGEVGTDKHVKALQRFFANRSKALLLLWIFFVVIYVPCLSFLCCRVCSLQPWDRLTSWLSCVLCVLVFLSLYHMVFCVIYGTWLSQFLIFAFLSTLQISAWWLSSSSDQVHLNKRPLPLAKKSQ